MSRSTSKSKARSAVRKPSGKKTTLRELAEAVEALEEVSPTERKRVLAWARSKMLVANSGCMTALRRGSRLTRSMRPHRAAPAGRES